MEQSKHFRFRKIILLVLPLMVFVFFINVISCNNQANQEVSVVTSMPDPVKLNYGQTKKAWRSIKAGDIDYLTFNTKYNRGNGDFGVSMQAFNNAYKKMGNSKELKKRNNNPVTFPQIGIGDNIIEIAKLNIIDASGDLMKFDSIVLTPNQWKDPKTGVLYLNYIVEVFPEMTAAATYETLPCPPCINCRPPDCPPEEPLDSAKTLPPIQDTLKKQ